MVLKRRSLPRPLTISIPATNLSKYDVFYGWSHDICFYDPEFCIDINEQTNGHMEGNTSTDASVEWTFFFTTLCLEIVSAGFDQASSPSKPQYALIGMLLAIAALLACAWELLHKGSLVVKRCQKLRCIYYLYPSHTFFCSLQHVFGLGSSICQCVFSTVQYIYFVHHADNPIRLSVLPAIFQICLAVSMLYR